MKVFFNEFQRLIAMMSQPDHQLLNHKMKEYGCFTVHLMKIV